MQASNTEQTKNQDFETSKIIQIQTPYLGMKEQKIVYMREDKVTLSMIQKELVKTIVSNHMQNKDFVVTYYSIGIYRNFVSIVFFYFPKEAHNTVYTQTRKNIWIGKSGGIRKFTCATGLGKDRNLKGIWRHYIKADER